LGAVCFVQLKRARRFVIQLVDELPVARTTDLLGLSPSHFLRGIVKRLADEARGTRESAHHLTRGFVDQVMQTSTRLRQHAGFAPLQPLPLPRALLFAALGFLKRRQMFVSCLYQRLRRTSTDQYALLAISGSEKRIDAKVHTDNRLLRAWHLFDFADKHHTSHLHPGFHEAARQVSRQGNMQRAACAMRQQEIAVADTRVLVRIHHVMITRSAPRIPSRIMPLASEAASRRHRFTELTDDLLRRLRR
jgi:hypothetical protein